MKQSASSNNIFMMPLSLAVLVRSFRPYFSVALGASLVLYRLVFGSQHGTSLLHLLADAATAVSLELASLNVVGAALLGWCWTLLLDLFVLLMFASVYRLGYVLLEYSIDEWKDKILSFVFEFARTHSRHVQKQLQEQRQETMRDAQAALRKDPNRTITRRLPAKGIASKQILGQMQAQGIDQNKGWKEGRVSGAVYPNGSDEHTDLMIGAYASFSWANPLHPGMWPSVNQYEAEVIAMTANLLGHSEAYGTTTSGGTESIVLAIKAHRDYYGRKRSIACPELVCGSTAHAAVDKACELLGIRKVMVPVDPVTFAIPPGAMERAITSNTILLYASAPCYPQGVIDPVEELGVIASKYDVGLHVDACLGGFVLPFAKQLIQIPKFDFEVPGVTSMSVDTHKYAYASKGTSVVLYKTEELRHAQYFTYAKWSGGMYTTPTIAGSRSGALLACAWAAMVSIGEAGYVERVKSILECSKFIADAIREMKDVKILGTSAPTMIVCFSSDTLDIYRIGDAMKKVGGWDLNALQHPASLHICVTLNTVPHKEKFVEDLRQAVQTVRDQGSKSAADGIAAIYGATATMPKGPINELLKYFTDATLSP